MELCSITPIKNAELMYNHNYVMLLAHLAEKYEDYVNLALSHTNYKIMDNSIIELGSAFSMERLVKQAIRCNVNEIILPDVYENGSETVNSVKKSIKWLRKHNFLGRFKLMAVVHGKNIIELYSCFNKLREIPEIDVIGVPKVLSTWCDRVREANVMACYTDKQIHLLGCWENMNEFTKQCKARSMDTCLPALLSIYNMKVFDDRQGRKIDLETDNVDVKKYNKIINNILCKK